MATKPLSFVQAQSQAIQFWARNKDNDFADGVTFLVNDPARGTVRPVTFSRNVDDYVVGECVVDFQAVQGACPRTGRSAAVCEDQDHVTC